jgi:hypothetical protein
MCVSVCVCVCACLLLWALGAPVESRMSDTFERILLDVNNTNDLYSSLDVYFGENKVGGAIAREEREERVKGE